MRILQSRVVVLMVLAALLQINSAHAADAPALDNAYVRASRNTAPCASAATPGCEDRGIVAMENIDIGVGNYRRKLIRGEVAVYKAGESYDPPSGGSYFEVAVKPNHPPVKAPPENIAPDKNVMIHENDRFFIYKERLDPGDTRPRHSHIQRVEIRINQGPQLIQWRDGQPPPSEPVVVNFREPVIHITKNIGDMPLRNFILEFKPDQRNSPAPN